MDEFTKRRVDSILKRYVGEKYPKAYKDKLRLTYKFRGNSVTLVEERPPYIGTEWTKRDFLQFRLDAGQWSIFWKDSRDKWHYVEHIAPDAVFERQLQLVDQDQTGIFWG